MAAEPKAMIQPLSPEVENGEVRCVWCNHQIAEAEEDFLQFDYTGEENFPAENAKDTEDGTKLRFECTECGTSNVFLAQIFAG